MQRIEQDQISSVSRVDYEIVKSHLRHIGAPFYDSEIQKHVNSTPILDITDQVANFVGDNTRGNSFYLKQEYKNPLTDSVKGRAVASMVLKAVESGAIYAKSGSRKRWIEPTSGNTGKGLAEIASLLGIEFTAVFSRLDVSEEIKASLARSGATILTIGSEYSLDDLETLAHKRGKSVTYYWSNIGGADPDTEAFFIDKVAGEKSKYGKQKPADKILNEIDVGLLMDALLPLALEASKAPIISRVQKGEFEYLKKDLLKNIPELSDPNALVAFLCFVGNTSMYLSTLLNQLGFSNVCSIQGGVKALRAQEGSTSSSEFCPLPGSSIARSSIEFVKKLVQDNPEEYFTFMQYENAENVHAHMTTTGPELKEQIKSLDYVVCTFGTGGTATGLAKYFLADDGGGGTTTTTTTRVIVAFPERPVEGIRTISGADGLAFYKPDLYGSIKIINTESISSLDQALLGYFAKNGIGVGPSTGVAILAAIDEAGSQRGKSFAIIAADGIENYESEHKSILGPRPK
ncbi:MAG: pyridoxal-phosphate dependent enzyme [Nitrososphaerales archaeon]